MKKLNWTQRNLIAEGIRAGKSNAQIAREIGVHRSTVGREIERNAESREKYCARMADDRSWQRQQEAMPKRIPMFGGVNFGMKLNVRNEIYTYHSHLHLNKIGRYLIGLMSWNTAYIRPRDKKRFGKDSDYKRYRDSKTSGQKTENSFTENQIPESSSIPALESFSETVKDSQSQKFSNQIFVSIQSLQPQNEWNVDKLFLLLANVEKICGKVPEFSLK
jgi:IS30 family transposase